MPDIEFDENQRARFPTKFHGEVTLSKGKWDDVCSHAERHYYRLNGEKVGTVLINPDIVRHNAAYPGQIFYYKEFDSVQIAPNIFAPPFLRWWAVIIDPASGIICTTYPLRKPKKGKEFKP